MQTASGSSLSFALLFRENVGELYLTSFDTGANTIDKVVFFVVFRVESILQIIAEQLGKRLIKTSTQRATQFAHNVVGCAIGFAIDKFNEDQALGESVVGELAFVIVKQVLFRLLNGLLSLLFGQRGNF